MGFSRRRRRTPPPAAGRGVGEGGAAPPGCDSALVWYLYAIPWVLPEFDVETCEPALRRIHERMQDGPLVIRQLRLLLVARLGDPTPAAMS